MVLRMPMLVPQRPWMLHNMSLATALETQEGLVLERQGRKQDSGGRACFFLFSFLSLAIALRSRTTDDGGGQRSLP